MEWLTKWFNGGLLKEPLNWAIVWVVASIWLLAFHTVMTGFTAMKSPGPSIGGAGPGTVASPVASDFSTTGLLAYGGTDPMSPWVGAGASPFTDGSESRYGEDGWTGNG